MRRSRLALIIGVAAMLAACASMRGLTCGNGERLVILDSLYFGTGTPNGVVAPEEWAEFLRTTVTPRFPQGFTVSLASGQWRGADGAIIREASHVLQLAHPDDPPSEQAILEVVAAYKAQFQQEALLRARVRACVSF